MRSALGKAVRKRFADRLLTRLPCWEPDVSASSLTEWRVFRWQPSSTLTCFLVLAIDWKQDNFTIECAWSRSGALPTDTRFQNPRDWPEFDIWRDAPKNGEFHFRLPLLWQPRDLWWWLVPEDEINRRSEARMDAMISGAHQKFFDLLMQDPPLDATMANVATCVDDAVEKIDAYAMPYFENLIDPKNG